MCLTALARKGNQQIPMGFAYWDDAGYYQYLLYKLPAGSWAGQLEPVPLLRKMWIVSVVERQFSVVLVWFNVGWSREILLMFAS